MGVVTTNYEKVCTEANASSAVALWICEKIVESIPGSALIDVSGFSTATRVVYEGCITLPGTTLALFVEVGRSSTLIASNHFCRITAGTYAENVVTLHDAVAMSFTISNDSSACSQGDVIRVTHNLVNEKLHHIQIHRTSAGGSNYTMHFYTGTWVSQYNGQEFTVVTDGTDFCTVPTTVIHVIQLAHAGSAGEYVPTGMAIMLPQRMYSTSYFMGDPLIAGKPICYCPQITGAIGQQYTVGGKNFICLLNANRFIEI